MKNSGGVRIVPVANWYYFTETCGNNA